MISLFILSKSYRNYQSNFQHPDFIQVEESIDTLRYKIFLILGILILSSGVLSLLLHFSYFSKMNYIFKIPLFAILGVGVTFALTVTLLDLVNVVLKIMISQMKRPAINSPQQIIPIICTSSIMGMLDGGIFGAIDMISYSLNSIGILLQKQQYYCMPISLIFGALCGLFASYDFKGGESDKDHNITEKGFKPLAQEEEV